VVVAGQQVRGPQQRGLPRRDERLEVLTPAGHASLPT
jgi:hypothetical protein